MKIINTIPFFMSNTLSLSSLKTYHQEFPSIFAQYFQHHCQNTEERLAQSIEALQSKRSHIQGVQENIIPIIQETAKVFKMKYGIDFNIEVSLIAGCFGSNAYTWRQFIPNITFALEKLTEEKDHLKAIVSHEFGHAAQNILSDQAGMNWNAVQWESPLTWLNQEGAAIHFSRKIIPGLTPSIYFSFDDQGESWLSFAQSHATEIIGSFNDDFRKNQPGELFREWFSIRGGTTYGYSRLGYFIGDLFFQSQVTGLGETKAIIAWRDTDFLEHVENWLNSKKSLSI